MRIGTNSFGRLFSFFVPHHLPVTPQWVSRECFPFACVRTPNVCLTGAAQPRLGAGNGWEILVVVSIVSSILCQLISYVVGIKEGADFIEMHRLSDIEELTFDLRFFITLVCCIKTKVKMDG